MGFMKRKVNPPHHSNTTATTAASTFRFLDIPPDNTCCTRCGSWLYHVTNPSPPPDLRNTIHGRCCQGAPTTHTFALAQVCRLTHEKNMPQSLHRIQLFVSEIANFMSAFYPQVRRSAGSQSAPRISLPGHIKIVIQRGSGNEAHASPPLVHLSFPRTRSASL
jgi:hypothetical protein